MTEGMIQEQVARYVAIKYRDAIFHSDFGSGAHLTKLQAIKQKRQNAGRRGFPDFQICEPIGKWNGMFLEIKKDGTRIVKRNGELVANDHIREQAKMIEDLRARGYYADFGIGFEACRKIIDAYMEGKASGENCTHWDS